MPKRLKLFSWTTFAVDFEGARLVCKVIHAVDLAHAIKVANAEAGDFEAQCGGRYIRNVIYDFEVHAAQVIRVLPFFAPEPNYSLSTK
jgi:hypothetical protein